MNKILSGPDCNLLYAKACAEILSNPDYETSPRGMKIKELINATLILEHPTNRLITLKERNLSNRYLAGELCFYLSGSPELDFITHYSKFWNKVSDDGKTVNSNYGSYLFHFLNCDGISQFEYCLGCLEKDIDSRKAVATIYSDVLHSRKSNDNPCTMNVQFLIRGKKLHMIVNMRSNDLWFGFAYDMPFFTVVQEMMYVLLKKTYPDITLGSYIHNAVSLHLYEKDWEKAEKCIGNKVIPELYVSMPRITMDSIHAIPELLEYEKELRSKCVGSLDTEPWTDWIKFNLWGKQE